MPITNFQISMNEYMRLVAEDAKKAEEGTIYGTLLKDLSVFTEKMMTYFPADGEKPKILRDKDYDDLIKDYTALAKDCENFLSADHVKNRLENKRVNIIKKLSSCIEQDLGGLIAADRTKNLTLSEVVKESRTRIVDLTGQDLSRVGGALSSRIPLRSTSGVEGFFTEKVVNESAAAYNEVLDRIPKILPSEFLDAYNNGGKDAFLKALWENPMEDLYSRNTFVKTESEEAYYNIMRTLKKNYTEADLELLLSENEGLRESLQKLSEDYRKVANQKGFFDAAGIQDKSRVDQRNSAMTDVARLLGMSGIIAKATPMKIIHNGQVKEGTFMEKAEGEDINRLTKNSKMLKADKDSFNHPEGLKALANLQVLDYICGNIDRHSGNILYQFGEENGKVVLTGICGIDNDTSFGTRTFEKSGVQDITPLSSIKNITKSCYESLLSFPVDTLKVVLADKLSKEELDAVCKRASLLKQRAVEIATGKEKKLKVVDDIEWGKKDYTYDKLTDKDAGITKTIKTVVRFIEKQASKRRTVPEESEELTYAEGKDVTDKTEVKFQEIYSKLEGFVTRAGNLKRKLHVNSEEYNNMLRSLKTALESGRELKEKMKTEGIDQVEFDEFARTVVELGNSSQTYMSAKKLSQHTELGKDRFALATDMRDLAQENFVGKEAPPKVEKLEERLFL